MNRTRWICIVLASLLFFSPAPVTAGIDALPSDVFLAIMLKALNYDRKIDRLAQGKIVIGVVYIKGDETALDFALKIRDNFLHIQSSPTLKHLPAQIVLLDFDKSVDKKTFEENLKQNHVSVVVVTEQDPQINKIIFETTMGLGINSVCYSSECVKQGAGLGIILKDNKSQMVINISVAQREGSDYAARFLALCEAVK